VRRTGGHVASSNVAPRRVHRARRLSLLVSTGVLSLALTTSIAGATPTTTTDPGLLPQTSAEPSFGVSFQHQMHALWSDVSHNNVTRAHDLFFPRSAYVKMKTGLLAYPQSDYAQRLLAFFDLDIAAYHRFLFIGGAPRLVAVRVNRGDAAWIAPGHCENLIGYWHLPGVRLVYRHGAKVYSVGVASLISWRGVWYVVHLGPNPRPTNVGTIDSPSSGPGVPGPAGGC